MSNFTPVDSKTEIARLKKENAELKAENLILKEERDKFRRKFRRAEKRD